MKNRTVSSNVAYLELDDIALKCNCIANSISVHLNPSRDYRESATITKIDGSANVVTIYPHGSETIDGAASVTLSRENDMKTLERTADGWAVSFQNTDAAKQKSVAKKPIQVATRCSANHVGTTLAGTTAGVTYRYSHVMKTECHSLQIVFANFYPTVTTESSNANDIIISVALEYDGGAQRLHFNGDRIKTISQGGIAITDPFWRDIPVGATFFTRVWVSVPVDANTYPQGLGLIASLGEGKGTGDLTIASGDLTNSTESGFGPAAIIGVPVADDAVAFALLGDSMVGDANGDGWPVLAVQDNYGYSLVSRPGSDVSTMQKNSNNAYRMRLLRFFTHVIVTFGANDFNLPTTFAVQEGYIKSFINVLKIMGLEVYYSTTTPRSTSTDAWATTTNQTVYNGNSYQTKRLTFNTNLRDGVYEVTVLDVAAAVESTTNSGKWKASYTGDGIHPLTAAKTAMLGNINLGLGK